VIFYSYRGSNSAEQSLAQKIVVTNESSIFCATQMPMADGGMLKTEQPKSTPLV
jgi:hypothetical protein